MVNGHRRYLVLYTQHPLRRRMQRWRVVHVALLSQSDEGQTVNTSLVQYITWYT